VPGDLSSAKLYGYTGPPKVTTELSFKVGRRPGLDICWWLGGSGDSLSPDEVVGNILEALTKAGIKADP
jgi:hypothetical protein